MSMLVCAGGRYKIMASPERICSWVDVTKDQENYLETPEIIDENTPLSPGEIEIMRNHSKISSKLCSPSRKTSKQKPSFRVHGSPPTSAKLVKFCSNFLEFYRCVYLGGYFRLVWLLTLQILLYKHKTSLFRYSIFRSNNVDFSVGLLEAGRWEVLEARKNMIVSQALCITLLLLSFCYTLDYIL